MQAHLCCVAPAAGSPRALCAAPPKRVPRARLQCQAAAEPASQPQQQKNQKFAQPSQASPLSLPPPRLALKEWAVSCQALAGGAQTLLFRKGGVREPTFKPRATYFALFPTSFHSDAQLLAPGVADAYAEAMSLEPRKLSAVPLPALAFVTGAWATRDATGVLEATRPLHVYGPGFLDARLKWRSKEPLTLLELRMYALQPPVELPVREEFWGCFSWLELSAGDGDASREDTAAAQWRAVPALSDVEFSERQALLRSALAGLDAEPLPLPQE